MKSCHHDTPGVFPSDVNSAAFFDTVAVHVWGKRRIDVLDYVSQGKNRPIGGYGRAYARAVPGRNRLTGNRVQFNYGVQLPYENISPFFLIVWADGLPVTWADVTLVIDAFLRRGWRARIAWVELTFDTEGIPLDLFSRELCTTARTIREFEGKYGTTLCVGSPNSSWRWKVYRKTYDVVRNEFTAQSRFLRKHGIARPQELSLLRKVNLWDHVSFRKVDQTHGCSLPTRIRDVWSRVTVRLGGWAKSNRRTGPDQSTEIIHPACKRVGLRPVSWHVFRYTYSTWADPTGESLKALQAQLGHTNSKLTLSVYTQPMPAAQRQVASKVADVLHRVLLPIAPKFEGDGDSGEEKKSANSVNLKQSRMVGATGFEPVTSTV